MNCSATSACYNINIPDKTLYIGKQPVQGWYNSPYNPSEPLNPSDPMDFNWNYTCYGQYINSNMSVWPGTTITWQDAGNSGGITWWQNGNNITFYFSYPDAYAYFYVTATNACGSSSALYRFLAVSDENCGGPPMRISISPNPASDKAELFLYEGIDKNRKKEILQIQVVDRLGITRSIIGYGKANKVVNLDLSKLRPGMYFIRVFDGTKWTSGKFVKH